jgi:hypothetical protein
MLSPLESRMMGIDQKSSNSDILSCFNGDKWKEAECQIGQGVVRS